MAKEKKCWSERICKKCNKIFKPYNNTQTMCKNPCRSPRHLTIEEANLAWVNRTEDDIKRRYKHCKNNFIRGDVRII